MNPLKGCNYHLPLKTFWRLKGPYIQGALGSVARAIQTQGVTNYSRQSQNGGPESRSGPRPFLLASLLTPCLPTPVLPNRGGADTADPVPGRVPSDVVHPFLIHSTPLLLATAHFRSYALRPQLWWLPAAAAAAALPALAHQAPSSLFRQGPPASKSPDRAGAEAEACDL